MKFTTPYSIGGPISFYSKGKRIIATITDIYIHANVNEIVFSYIVKDEKAIFWKVNSEWQGEEIGDFV